MDVERVMLEGRADLTKTLVDDLKGASGIENISVLNFQGREAFNKDAPLTDADVLKKIAETKMPRRINEKTRIIFYETLNNKEQCRTCLAGAPEVLGAVKVSISIEKEYNRSMNLILIVIVATVIACLSFSAVLWGMIRKMVISPVKSLEKAAHELYHGDLSFGVDIKSKDEIGRFGRAIKDSMLSISGILKRIREISTRIAYVAEQVPPDGAADVVLAEDVRVDHGAGSYHESAVIPREKPRFRPVWGVGSDP